jgi:hypothetical protein
MSITGRIGITGYIAFPRSCLLCTLRRPKIILKLKLKIRVGNENWIHQV